jgi:hypothetical protein
VFLAGSHGYFADPLAANWAVFGTVDVVGIEQGEYFSYLLSDLASLTIFRQCILLAETVTATTPPSLLAICHLSSFFMVRNIYILGLRCHSS